MDSSIERLKLFAAPFFLAMMVVYIAYHSFNGDHGLFTLFQTASQLESAQQEYAALSEERKTMEIKTSLLRSGSVHADMLDEEARRGLGFARADEVVMLK